MSHHEPLPADLRARVTIGVVCAVLFVLLVAPLEMMEIIRHAPLTVCATTLVIGVGLPALFGLQAWRLVRRWRTDPASFRDRPNKRASTTTLLTSLVAIPLATEAASRGGLTGWAALALGATVALVVSFGGFLVAKRQDPRIHFFRKPEPITEEDDKQAATDLDAPR